MGVTKIWDIKVSLHKALRYVTDPNKTVLQNDAASTDAINTAIQYAANDNKTQGGRYVTAINCNATCAEKQFANVKARFDKRNGILAFHAYQSFADYDNLTPDIAHEIGVRFAEEIWGGRFQVIVSTHLNTDCLHNHFVVNSVSFVDGKKYHDSRSAYRHMREVSDRLCAEYNLTVIENPQRGCEPVYMSQLSKAGMPTRYNMAREAIDEAISISKTLREFELNLHRQGYTVQLNPKRKYWTITPKGWERPIRMARLGEAYTNEQVLLRIKERQIAFSFAPFQRKGVKPKQYLLLTRKERINKVGGLQGLYLRYCYMLGYLPKYTQNANRVHYLLRDELLKCEQYSKQARLLSKYEIGSKQDLSFFMERKEMEKEELVSRRSNLQKRMRKEIPEDEKETMQRQINTLNEELKTVRVELRLAKDIEQRSDTIEEKLKRVEADREKEMRQR